MEDIKVTVLLSTYNQEKYLREAIDSILMQKCGFRYELIIADDCSSDGTQAIATEYRERFPDIITTYFTPENIGDCRKFTNCIDMGLLRGEYIAQLEGDDYWLDENRLQMLADFLDEHPEYSRVSHDRLIIDENGNVKGTEQPKNMLGKAFTIEDFLSGKNYSSVGSMYRNYYKTVGNKYHGILQSSKNVSDFQDMFITQDFGPVFIMDKCLGTYRCRSSEGESNYNSLVKQESRCVDKINIVCAVQSFYGGRYDLTSRIRTEQRKLYAQAVTQGSEKILELARSLTDEKTELELLAECVYLARRSGNKKQTKFIKKNLTKKEKIKMPFSVLKYTAVRLYKKIRHIPYEDKRRGYINLAKENPHDSTDN